MYKDDIKIPLERVAILVGKKGSVKRKIEKTTHTKLLIDSREGLISITGKESLDVYDSRQMIKAIARGFNPEIALSLEDKDLILDVIDIQEYAGRSKAKLARLRGRCIGTKGKSRRLIEELTSTNISIYGKTIAILGYHENVVIAKKAMESLLSGAKHGNIYKWLEKMQSSLKQEL